MQYGSSVGSRVAVADFTRELRKVDTRHAKINTHVDYGTVTSTSVAAGAYAFPVQFNDINDATNYATSWDMYKIESVEYYFIPLSQPPLPAASLAYSLLYVVNDYDDATLPTGAAALCDYANLTIAGPGEKHVRKIRPHCAEALTTSAASSIIGAGNIPAPWIDITYGTVNHYGVKVIVTQSTSTNVNAWRVFAKIEVSLKSQR